MTDVTAGQQLALLSQWFDFQGGALTDLDATPTITIVAIAAGTPALAATSTGVTHPGTGSYGYAWTPAANLTPGAYLATWSGLKSGAPVAASETVTVLPAGPAATVLDAGVFYATREEVKAELDVRETARSNLRIDRALADATGAVHGLTHRVFYPVLATRYFDWPARGGSAADVLRLDSNELVAVTALASGATSISADDYFLRRADDRDEPPYTRIELNRATSASFGNGTTWQRDVAITGLFGYRNDETPLGTVVEALDSTETGVDVDAATSAGLGVGSVLRLDAERLIVRERAQLDTGQTLAGGGLTNQNNSVVVTVQSGGVFAAGEVILIDGERMRVDDIAGNTLIVSRAWDGSTIAAHTAGAAIYAPRTLTVTRGALGTVAASHTSGTTIARWDAPGSVRQLCLAEALVDLLQGRSGYARTAGSGDNERETSGKGINDLRDRVYTSHGRKARSRAV
ncbi:hypothetical protein [Streptomyces sp. NPDC005302]|uniref:hypothetical protein n=1 Tax=Streptomyces sp. NPDC005302 TaxID=3154675 RepID=UPI00339DAABD